VFQRISQIAVGVALLAAPLGLAGTAQASAGPAVGTAAVTASSVSASSWQCGYYSGNAETVKGDTGDRVREVQCLVVYVFGQNVGTSGPAHDGVDGEFGTKTYNAVVSIQKSLNSVCTRQLSVDGKVGTHTWSALRAGGCPTA
jgi:peptidoglycan hydrolase-like protein with peptidoglycan-binding domain